MGIPTAAPPPPLRAALLPRKPPHRPPCSVWAGPDPHRPKAPHESDGRTHWRPPGTPPLRNLRSSGSCDNCPGSSHRSDGCHRAGRYPPPARRRQGQPCRSESSPDSSESPCSEQPRPDIFPWRSGSAHHSAAPGYFPRYCSLSMLASVYLLLPMLVPPIIIFIFWHCKEMFDKSGPRCTAVPTAKSSGENPPAGDKVTCPPAVQTSVYDAAVGGGGIDDSSSARRDPDMP